MTVSAQFQATHFLNATVDEASKAGVALSAGQKKLMADLLEHTTLHPGAHGGEMTIPGIGRGTPWDLRNALFNKVSKLSEEQAAKGISQFGIKVPGTSSSLSTDVKAKADAAVKGIKGLGTTVKNNFAGPSTFTGSKVGNAAIRGAGIAAGVGIASTIRKEDSWVVKSGKMAASVGVTAVSLLAKGKGGKGI